MDITIRSNKIKITKSISDYINLKLNKIDKYFTELSHVHVNVLVKVQNSNQIIEVSIPTETYLIRSEESHKDLYSAIDLVVDKLERQIVKNKTKLKKKSKLSKTSFNFDYSIDNIEEDKSKIVRRKTINQKPMSEDEAILQMNLIDHDFFIFNNIDNNKICVLYHRKDGNFGIISSQ